MTMELLPFGVQSINWGLCCCAGGLALRIVCFLSPIKDFSEQRVLKAVNPPEFVCLAL